MRRLVEIPDVQACLLTAQARMRAILLGRREVFSQAQGHPFSSADDLASEVHELLAQIVQLVVGQDAGAADVAEGNLFDRFVERAEVVYPC